MDLGPLNTKAALGKGEETAPFPFGHTVPLPGKEGGGVEGRRDWERGGRQ